MELAGQYGANTIRTWTVSDETQQWLETAKKSNQKMILGIWMPHQGKNSGKDYPYEYDYRENETEGLDNLKMRLTQYDAHPSVLMWGLGNEVHLEENYLTNVNVMAKAIHDSVEFLLVQQLSVVLIGRGVCGLVTSEACQNFSEFGFWFKRTGYLRSRAVTNCRYASRLGKVADQILAANSGANHSDTDAIGRAFTSQ